MCGRYTNTRTKKEIADHYGVDLRAIDLQPRYNVAPGQLALVIVEDKNGRRAEMMRWGLVPSWAKDEKIGHKMINARSETILEKPSFRSSFINRRCLVVADGFYEWQVVGTEKKPIHIFLKRKPLFGFAGLWDEWVSPVGEVIRSFAIITTEANAFLKPVHERMPVIIGPDDEDRWLDPNLRDGKALMQFLQPYDSALMDYKEVSRLVNSPKNDSPDCVQAITIS